MIKIATGKAKLMEKKKKERRKEKKESRFISDASVGKKKGGEEKRLCEGRNANPADDLQSHAAMRGTERE